MIVRNTHADGAVIEFEAPVDTVFDTYGVVSIGRGALSGLETSDLKSDRVEPETQLFASIAELAKLGGPLAHLAVKQTTTENQT